jgi:hypothetical protein
MSKKILLTDNIDSTIIDVSSIPDEAKKIYEHYCKQKNITEKDKTDFVDFICRFILKIKTIQESLKFDGGQDVCHYTKTGTLKYIVDYKDKENEKENEKRFHLSNVAYMNDPSEGKIFVNLLNKYKSNSAPNSYKFDMLFEPVQNERDIYIRNVYIANYTTAKDYLPMWAQYGDNGKGCCLVFKDNIFKQSIVDDLTLYRVLYIEDNDKEEDKEIVSKLESIVHDLEEWMPRLENDNTIKQWIINNLEEIRFLFKSSSYKYEEEVRLIIHAKKGDVKIDDRDTLDVPKLYFELEKKLEYKEVILGPKNEKPFEVAPFLLHSSVEKVTKSNIDFQ